MKKFIAAVFFITFLSGCASLPCNDWQGMSFTAPLDKTEQELITEKTVCLVKVDGNHPLRCVIGGIAALIYWPRIVREYQDCMSVKGFPCKEECAYEPGKK